MATFNTEKHEEHATHPSNYGLLLGMAALSFVAMYLLMYAMVDVLGNVYAHLNQIYMAGLMAAPMVLIELVLMRRMYPNQKWNAVIVAISALLLILCWIGIRQQAAISDQQFLRSMIPHHGAAILMCKEADIHAPDVVKLCERIVVNQQAEIDQMKAMPRANDSGP